MTKILAFAGSARKDSLNKKLVSFAVEKAGEHGAEVTLIDLRDFEMPLYNGDFESDQGVPENATRLFELLKEHKGLLLACPEYNGSITAVFKNTIDWVSRPHHGESGLTAFRGKTAALLSASPGGYGGMRGLVHVRSILTGIGVLVLPSQVAVPNAHEIFDASGMLTDEKIAKRVDALSAELVATTSKLS